MSDFEKLVNNFRQKILESENQEEINKINSEIFGKKGFINAEFSKISSIPSDDKKKLAIKINNAKQELTEVFRKTAARIQQEQLNKSITNQKIDVTLCQNKNLKLVKYIQFHKS
tara:strand:- start:76 stop:417 length:342 start_codon:yes stop_codon:yes gene_type:complete